jgi:hypothetical protein
VSPDGLAFGAGNTLWIAGVDANAIYRVDTTTLR